MTTLIQSITTTGEDFLMYKQDIIGLREQEVQGDPITVTLLLGGGPSSVSKRRNSIRLQFGNLLRKITKSSFILQQSDAFNHKLAPISPGLSCQNLSAELALTHSNMPLISPAENFLNSFFPESPTSQCDVNNASDLVPTPSFFREDIEHADTEARCRAELNESVTSLGRFHRVSIQCMEDLASCLHSQGDWLLAENCYHDCLEATEMIYGYESIEAIRVVGKLAAVVQIQGKLEEARMFYNRALDLRTKVQGNEHISTLKTAHNLALLLEEIGDLAEAEKFHILATLGFENILGPLDLNTMKATDNLARLFRIQKMFPEAESLYLRLLQSKLKVYGQHNVKTLGTLVTLAAVLEDLGKIRVAGEFYKCAIIGYAQILGVKHDRTGKVFSVYSDMVVRNSISKEEAECFYREILSRPLGLDGPPPDDLSLLLERITAQRQHSVLFNSLYS